MSAQTVAIVHDTFADLIQESRIDWEEVSAGLGRSRGRLKSSSCSIDQDRMATLILRRPRPISRSLRSLMTVDNEYGRLELEV